MPACLDPTVDCDETFVFLPSVHAAWAAQDAGLSAIEEGKSIGTAQEKDLVLMTDPTMLNAMMPGKYANDRKKGVTVGKRVLDATKVEVEDAMNKLVTSYGKKAISPEELRESIIRLMKMAWRKTALAGIRASGQPGSGTPGTPAKISKDEEAWMLSAMKHEMLFLNGFIHDIKNGTGKMPYPRRIKMYVDALDSFYESSRIIGLPANSLIYWMGPKDKRTCASCAYMFAHKVFTKKNLGAVPRSGFSLCLSNCRDRLLVRVVSLEQVIAVNEAGLSRSTHIKNLRKIKRDGF